MAIMFIVSTEVAKLCCKSTDMSSFKIALSFEDDFPLIIINEDNIGAKRLPY